MNELISERVIALGTIGQVLLARLPRDCWKDIYIELDAQRSRLAYWVNNNIYIGMAYSLIICNLPIQINFNERGDSAVQWLVHNMMNENVRQNGVHFRDELNMLWCIEMKIEQHNAIMRKMTSALNEIILLANKQHSVKKKKAIRRIIECTNVNIDTHAKSIRELTLHSNSIKQNLNKYRRGIINRSFIPEKHKKIQIASCFKNDRGLYSNVLLEDVMQELSHNKFLYNKAMACINSDLNNQLYNDQSCAILLMGTKLRYWFDDPYKIVAHFIRNNDDAKVLSTIIKTCGLLNSRLGSLMCEMSTLRGMPSNIDNDIFRNEIKQRCTKNMYPHKLKTDILRYYVRSILLDEIDMTRYKRETIDTVWDKRWEWCKNGAHSKYLGEMENKYALKTDTDKDRIFRKSAIENYNWNIINDFNSKTYISCSIKPEVGKEGRIIMAGDTRNYCAFEYILKPVEQAWRGNNVLLSPGDISNCEMSKLLGEMNRSGVVCSLDYDAFDTQHTLKDQEMVIEEICLLTDVDIDLSVKLRKSFYQMRVFYEGKDYGYVKYALMSGHRGTTILNSILNRAYILYCADIVGIPLNKIRGLHTGDDVVICVESYNEIDMLIKCMYDQGLRLNRSKQSIGSISNEFLRIAYGKECARGYLSRATAKAICGNWESDKLNDAQEYIGNWRATMWTLFNRSYGDKFFLKLFTHSIVRTTGLPYEMALGLCDNSLILNSGVGRSETNYIMKCNVDFGCEDTNRTVQCREWMKGYATEDYLSKGISLIERIFLTDHKLSPKETMFNMSYRKMLERYNIILRAPPEYNEIEKIYMENKLLLDDIIVRAKKSEHGILNRYPILNMYRKMISYNAGLKIMDDIGYDVGTNVKENMYLMWDDESNVFSCDAFISYQDLMLIRGKCDKKIITSHYAFYI